jgi:phytoene synthase
MQDAFAHCEALLRAADKDRFLTTLFAPAEHRNALIALYAFNVEIARVREVVREALAGEIRLQWWSDIFGGERRAGSISTTNRWRRLPISKPMPTAPPRA